VQLPPDALAEQLHLATQLAGLLTDSSRAVLQANSAAAQLKALPAGSATSEAVKAYEQRLAQLLGTADKEASEAGKPVPEAKASLTDLQDHFATLYTEVTRGDGAPTAAQKSATDTAQRAFMALAGEWRKLQDDLPELNRRLRAARLAAIRTDLPPPRDLNVADEE
jgi:hypothetical protein